MVAADWETWTKYDSIVYQQMSADDSTRFLAQHDLQRVPLKEQKSERYWG